jgi:protein gp37
MAARKAGKRARVFCASMADVFDNHPDVDGAREQLWELIAQTPRLDWLILTKRIGNAKLMLPPEWKERGYPRNVWLGISVVNQVEADRDIPKLLETPATVRFLSCEPLLGPIDLEQSTYKAGYTPEQLDWVICGGESGSGARPMEQRWAELLAYWCQERLVKFFMKQGSQANWPHFKDFSSFPSVLQRREWPT